jgi:hypothetical protein
VLTLWQSTFLIFADPLTKYQYRCADPLRLVALPRAELGRAGPPGWEEASSRRVERGSRLVIAVPKHSRYIPKMEDICAKCKLIVTKKKFLAFFRILNPDPTCQMDKEEIKKTKINKIANFKPKQKI